MNYLLVSLSIIEQSSVILMCVHVCEGGIVWDPGQKVNK